MTLDALAEALAERIAERVAAKLSTRAPTDDLLGEVDLVPRYFSTKRSLTDAVNLRGLAASRAGRAIVVRREDLYRYLAEHTTRRTPSVVFPRQLVDADERQQGDGHCVGDAARRRYGHRVVDGRDAARR